MKLQPPLRQGVLLKRYRRFLADVETQTGERLTIHCPNTGAMRGCAEPGSECWYSQSANPRRKYPCTLEVVVTAAGRVGVNTNRANALIAEALELGALQGFEDAGLVRAEVAIPDARGRFDFLLDRNGARCYLEVKSVTLVDEQGFGLFPDAVSERALKHVVALQRRVAAGDEAALVFCVQHTGIKAVSPADHIHPAYGAAVRMAHAAGVKVCAYGCLIERDELRINQPLPVVL